MVNALLNLLGRGVGRKPQPGRVAERAGDGQLFVDDVVLGDVADHRAVQVEMAVQVVPVDQHLSFGACETVEGHH